MNLIVPDWTGAPTNVSAFSSTRHGGVSLGPYDDGAGGGGLNLGMHVGDLPEHVAQNRALLNAGLPQSPMWLNQVHGTHVLNADQDIVDLHADACITTQAGVVCAIQTADCLPVLFCDVHGRVVGAAHAGWRGLVGGVLENTVMQMRETGAGEVLAWLGPAIGPECFEVGKDVVQAFADRNLAVPNAFKPIPSKSEKFLANLYVMARKILNDTGVHRIYGGQYCTVSTPLNFYSYRRDGVTGRMASLIWIKKD